MDPYRSQTSLSELKDKVDALEERIEALELFHQGREKCSEDLALDRMEKGDNYLRWLIVFLAVALVAALSYAATAETPVIEPFVVNVIEVELVECCSKLH